MKADRIGSFIERNWQFILAFAAGIVTIFFCVMEERYRASKCPVAITVYGRNAPAEILFRWTNCKVIGKSAKGVKFRDLDTDAAMWISASDGIIVVSGE